MLLRFVRFIRFSFFCVNIYIHTEPQQAISAIMMSSQDRDFSVTATTNPGAAIVPNVSGGQLDLRLIPEFNGTNMSVSEWLEKAELVCQLCGVSRLANVPPLRLSGGAFSVYQQLSDSQKSDYGSIKNQLLTAFAVDKFSAYDQFVSRCLHHGESVDVYLADMRRLSSLFGGVNDNVMICSFVSGLPEETRHALRGSSRADSLELSEVVARARSLLVESTKGVVAALHGGNSATENKRAVRCFRCNDFGHIARWCKLKKGDVCFRCRKPGHFARSCPGNEGGEVVSAPASSPQSQT